MGLLDSRAPAARFPDKGTTVAGRVTKRPDEVQQRDFDSGDPLVWDDGSPRMQLVIEVDTGIIDPSIEDDDGCRTLYVKGAMLAGLRAAVRRARVREITEGGRLTVTYVDDEPLPKGKRGFPKKLYEAVYEPPAGGEPAPDKGPVTVEPSNAKTLRGVTERAAARLADTEPPF